jgi:bacterioferritin-associated ferredoxin
MNTENPESDQEIVCQCSGTTTAQIERLVARGVRDLDGVSRATGACSGCGGCDYDVERLLARLLADAGASG